MIIGSDARWLGVKTVRKTAVFAAESEGSNAKRMSQSDIMPCVATVTPINLNDIQEAAR
jgi:hypothetical protein